MALPTWPEYQSQARARRDKIMRNGKHAPSDNRRPTERVNYAATSYFTVGWSPAMGTEPLLKNHADVENPCRECKGRGLVDDVEANKRLTHFHASKFCPACKGTGRNREN